MTSSISSDFTICFALLYPTKASKLSFECVCLCKLRGSNEWIFERHLMIKSHLKTPALTHKQLR